MERSVVLGVVRGPFEYASEFKQDFRFIGNDIKCIYVGSTPNRRLEYDAKYCSAKIQKLLPDYISGCLMRGGRVTGYSPCSFVQLNGLENFVEDADVLLSHEMYSFISRQCAKFASQHNKKHIIAVEETLPNMPLNYIPPFSWNVKYVSKHADKILAYTELSKWYLEKIKVPENKIEVLYPGINLNSFKPLKQKSHDKLRILFVGRYGSEKGMDLLLQSFIKLYKYRKDVELWVVARPPDNTGKWHLWINEEKQYQNQANMLANKYPIKIIGEIEHGDINAIYQKCDIFCHPSRLRKVCGFPIREPHYEVVLMEAMAAGLPIVSTECGAIPEIIGRRNLIVNQNSVNDLTDALLKMINDEELRNELSVLNRKRAEEMFDFEKQRIKGMEIIKELIQ